MGIVNVEVLLYVTSCLKIKLVPVPKYGVMKMCGIGGAGETKLSVP